MPSYNLFVTTPQGHTFKTLNSPYPTRQAAMRTIIMSIRNSPEVTLEDATAFARKAAGIPLGQTIEHATSGVTFRTEEA